MQLQNKTEKITHMQNKDKLERGIAVQDMLMQYQDTSHPATRVSPYQVMANRRIRTKLD